jgi:uncharacterized membrane protein YgcG
VNIRKTITFCLGLCLIAHVTLATQAATPRGATSYQPTATVPQSALSAEQMDNLLAPIALYPDPLLAQVFPASTFVDQIDQAARYLRGNNNNVAGVDNQSWDVSVRSVAHYPQVVYMMSEKLDWTTALGQAYVNQSTAVLMSVQRLRARAKKAGYLVTTPQQIVIVETDVIKVVPAQPQVIYVPTYNPQVVYVQPSSGPSTGTVVAAAAISFGVGLAIGAWLNNDCNWHSHTVYYHGWHGSGWIHTSSAHVHVNSVYVNRSYANVHVNRTVVNRNVNYNNINHYNNVNRNVNYNNVNVNNINRNNVNVNNVNRNNVNRNNVNTNNVNRNNVNTNNVSRNNVANKNINTNDARINSMRGHNNAAAGTANRTATRPAQPTQQRSSAFGGFGGSGQTRAAGQRGQASRASAQQSRSGGGRRSGGRRN